MGIIIDLIIILIVSISTFIGYKKGLISVAVKLLAFIIALIITFILYRPIGSIIINNTQIDEKIQEVIEQNINSRVDNYERENEDRQITNEIIKSAKNGMLPNVARELSINVVYTATMIILFIISRICLILINLLSEQISKFPIIKQCNKFGGTAYGLIRGMFIISAILLIMNLIAMANPETTLNKIIDETYLTKMIMTYNVLNIFV